VEIYFAGVLSNSLCVSLFKIMHVVIFFPFNCNSKLVFIGFFAVGGWLASLSVAGYTAIAVRNIVKTEMTDAEPMAKPSPFSAIEVWTWTGIFLISFVAALLNPTILGTSARTCLPFLLASTVLGYIVGSG
jgi:hypothetical protein